MSGPSLGLRIAVALVNAVARLGEAAVMRFPNDTDTDTREDHHQ